MKSLNMTDGRGHRLAALAAGMVVLMVAGCAGSNPTGSRPSATLPGRSVPAPTIASTPSEVPSPSPQITLAPPTPPPPAGSLPVVNSCDPASVPSAVPVTATESGGSGSFTLHVPVLMYHRIVPFAEAGDSITGLVVPPATFDVQLTALETSGWHTITMATLANDLAAQVQPSAKTVVITIDDGWYDGYTYALPILAKHGFVATYYVIAGRIDQPDFLSSYQLRALVSAGDEIGDHTMDHVNLNAQDATDLKYEIDAAAARIAQVTGVWPESLAYPSGHEDAKVVAAVGACQELRMAVLEGALPVTTPAPAPKIGATQGPPKTTNLQGYETWSFRFLVPRVRVTPGTTPAVLLGLLGDG